MCAAPSPPAPPRTPQQQAHKAAEVAAGRFYDNPHLDLPRLGAPLLAQARTAVHAACRRYALCVPDQSPLHYTRHAAKADRQVLYNKDDLGYDLASALLLSDRDGQPLSVPYVGLAAADGVHSTRRVKPLKPRPGSTKSIAPWATWKSRSLPCHSCTSLTARPTSCCTCAVSCAAHGCC